MKQRIITGLILIGVVLGFFSFGENGFLFIVLTVLSIAAFELYSLVSKRVKPIIFVLMLVTLLASPFLNVNELVAMLCGFFLVLAFLTVVTQWFSLDLMGLIFLMTTLVAMAIYSAVYLFDLGYLAFLWILLGNYMTDTMAYFVGMALGKRKLIPSVSPNKTWEGSIGGYFSGLIVSLIYGYFVLPEVFNYDFIILASLLIPLAAQIGDLFFSKIKRRYDIKDFGTLLPAHGGVLDRIDSLVFSLLVMMLLLNAFGIL